MRILKIYNQGQLGKIYIFELGSSSGQTKMKIRGGCGFELFRFGIFFRNDFRAKETFMFENCLMNY